MKISCNDDGNDNDNDNDDDDDDDDDNDDDNDNGNDDDDDISSLNSCKILHSGLTQLCIVQTDMNRLQLKFFDE